MMKEVPALIIDANSFSEKKLSSEFKNLILKYDLLLVWSDDGQLSDELKSANKKRFVQHSIAGKFFCVCNTCVERKAEHLRNQNTLESNDHHIIALAIVSAANTIVTEDSKLVSDFKNCNKIDRWSKCRKRQGKATKRIVINLASTPKNIIQKKLREASAKHEHCSCSCEGRGC